MPCGPRFRSASAATDGSSASRLTSSRSSAASGPVGSANVDRAVEATLELVHEIGDVRRAVRGRAVVRAQEHPVLVVAVRRRARPERAVLLVRVELRQELREPLLELALQPEAVEVD